MITRSWARPSVLALAMLAGAAGQAQPTTAAPAEHHPIQRGFEAAWSRQPEARSAPLRRDAAEAALGAARRWTPQAPALELSARTDRLHRNEGVREYDATLSIPLWLPGERAGSQAAAQADRDALDARLRAARWKTAEAVRAAYWDHARAAQERQLADARLANAHALAADVARRVHAGDLATADSHQAEGAVAAAQAAQAEAGNALARAARRWQTLTGLAAPADAADAPPEPMPADAAGPAHPELAELAAKAESARRQRILAGVQARANPELSLGAVRERDAFGERFAQSMVVGLRIPLGRAHDSEARIASASAQQMEAEAALALDSQRLDAEAELARGEVLALRAALDAAERRARLAAENRGFFERSFRLGETDLPTRLRVELEAFEAERQAARARIALHGAISQLRQSLGLLPG